MTSLPDPLKTLDLIHFRDSNDTGSSVVNGSGGKAAPSEVPSLEFVLSKVPADSADIIHRAYDLANRLHEGQLRVSGEPYILHPLMVACYLADLNMDTASIAAGLLHDVLEDTDITYERLAEEFPQPIPEIVKGVTKIGRISFQTTREAQVENLRMMILAMAQDIRVVIVKLCDRLHNMKTLKHLPPDRRLKVSQETLDIYAPLANRLGISRIKQEMEDLAMRWLFPDAYQKLTRLVAQKKREREKFVDESVEFLKRYLGKHYSKLHITGRPKHFYSIYKKMKEQGLGFDQIYDLHALRIICESESQCYEILGLIHAVWHPVPGRIKDYIGMPKKNMYQSLHTTVIGLNGARTEIQIRTQSMNQVAEFGIAAHWKYKEQAGDLKNDERLTWLRQLTEWITDVNEPSGLLEALKKDVFADHVMCFTPKGDVIELPANATPIDFAYAIHTKIGETCVGAKVNDRMVNLRTRLSNGDVVEIQTSPSGHPARDWLDYVVTGRARQKIKHWLKSKNSAEYVESGRRQILQILEERQINVPKAELESTLEKLLPVYKLQTLDDLLAEIGFRSISAHAAVARANPDWAQRPRKAQRKPLGTVIKTGRTQTGPITVEGMEGLSTRIAACCHPIPGDPIVAFVTRGRGLTIHHRDCKALSRAVKDPKEAARVLPARWNSADEASHNVILRVVAEDRSGLLNDISGILSRHQIFINGCLTKSDRKKGTATLQFDVNVSDVNQLENVLNAIRGDRGIISAERRKRMELRS